MSSPTRGPQPTPALPSGASAAAPQPKPIAVTGLPGVPKHITGTASGFPPVSARRPSPVGLGPVGAEVLAPARPGAAGAGARASEPAAEGQGADTGLGATTESLGVVSDGPDSDSNAASLGAPAEAPSTADDASNTLVGRPDVAPDVPSIAADTDHDLAVSGATDDHDPEAAPGVPESTVWVPQPVKAWQQASTSAAGSVGVVGSESSQPDAWEVCQVECKRVTDRLRGLGPSRITDVAAACVHEGLQQAADETAAVEGTDAHELPTLEAHGLADQVMVIVEDALSTEDEQLLNWLAGQLMHIRHRLAML